MEKFKKIFFATTLGMFLFLSCETRTISPESTDDHIAAEMDEDVRNLEKIVLKKNESGYISLPETYIHTAKDKRHYYILIAELYDKIYKLKLREVNVNYIESGYIVTSDNFDSFEVIKYPKRELKRLSKLYKTVLRTRFIKLRED